MGLSTGRQTAKRSALLLSVALAAAAVVYEGGMVAVNASGLLVPASASNTIRVIGVATKTVDNAAGGLAGEVDRGCFRFDNSADSDEITAAHIGAPCFAVDDQTVALTSNSGARPYAGIVLDVDDNGVWVDFSQNLQGTPLALVVVLSMGAMSNKASDAAVLRAVAPIAGTITKIRSVLNEPLATGDATLTGKIGANAITNGVITITQAGSAAGDVDEATPSAANTVAVGDVISFTGGGASTATSTSQVQVEITPA
jgi:hypothetical protein